MFFSQFFARIFKRLDTICYRTFVACCDGFYGFFSKQCYKHTLAVIIGCIISRNNIFLFDFHICYFLVVVLACFLYSLISPVSGSTLAGADPVACAIAAAALSTAVTVLLSATSCAFASITG